MRLKGLSRGKQPFCVFRGKPERLSSGERDEMRAWTALAGIAICLTAQAQPVGEYLLSIEAMVQNSEQVVDGRILDIRPSDAKYGSWWSEITIDVDAMIKGEPQERMVINLPAGRSFLEASRQSQHRLLFLVSGGTPDGAVMDLDDPNLVLSRSDLTLVTDADAAIAALRSAKASQPSAERVETFLLRVPRKSDKGMTWWSVMEHMRRDYYALAVPVGPDLEHWMRWHLQSSDPENRQQGIYMARHLKSPETISLLKPLLADPYESLAGGLFNTFGYEVRVYPLRKEAFELLAEWGVEVEKPLIERRFPRHEFIREMVVHRPMSEDDLSSLERCRRLTRLFMQQVPVTDEQVARIGKMTSLEYLQIRVTDDQLKQLGGLKNLKHLALTWSLITSEGLRIVSDLPNLVQLSVAYTSIGDEELMTLAGVESLKVILIRESKITPSGISRFQKLRPDVTFED